MADFKKQAVNVLQHEDLQDLLLNSTQSINEKSIIDITGKSYRPDKVLFTAKDEVIVIDYKFTKKQSRNHVKQVHGYRNLLQEMGYPKVSTYLFYATIGELILV